MDCARQGWPRGHGPECGWDGVGDGDGDGDGRWGRRQVGMGQRWGRVRNGDMDRHWGRGQMGTRGRDGDRKRDRVQRWGYKKKPEYRQGSGSRKEDGDEGLGSEHEGEKVGTQDKVGTWERRVTETGADTRGGERGQRWGQCCQMGQGRGYREQGWEMWNARDRNRSWGQGMENRDKRLGLGTGWRHQGHGLQGLCRYLWAGVMLVCPGGLCASRGSRDALQA